MFITSPTFSKISCASSWSTSGTVISASWTSCFVWKYVPDAATGTGSSSSSTKSKAAAFSPRMGVSSSSEESESESDDVSDSEGTDL